MPTSSIIDLYTTVLAWYMYDAFWSVITGTGLVMLPFLFMIIKTVMEDSEREKKQVRQFVRLLEIRIYLMIATMVFCAQPTINLYTSNMQYTHMMCSVEDDIGLVRKAEKMSYGSTETNADVYADQFSNSLNGHEIKLPVWWYWFGKLSHALTLSLGFELPCNPDFKSMADGMSRMRIDDTQLNREVSRFHKECWQPSAAKYVRESAQRDFVLPPSFPSGAELDKELSWIGSSVFMRLDGYYNEFRALTPVTDFFWQEERDGPVAGQQQAGDSGVPHCDEWWEPDNTNQDGLRERLLGYIKSKDEFWGECEGCWGATFRYWADRYLGTEFQREKEDFLLRAALASDAKATETFQRSFREDGFMARLSTAGANIGIFLTSIPNRSEALTYKAAAPIVQAVVLMVFVMFLPILMTLSMFDLGRVVGMSVIYFSVIFWGYLFSLAYYFENFVMTTIVAAYTDAQMNEHSLFYLATGGSISDMNDVSLQVLQWMGRMSYVFLPLLFTLLLGVAGHHTGSAIGGMITNISGSIAKGGASGPRAVTRLGR